MDANTLTELIDQRFETLNELMTISQEQIRAIDEHRITDLMRILSDKQKPINRLTQLGKAISTAAADDPEARVWPDPAMRDRCRDRQESCERMHLELLAIEAECESRLQASREDVRSQLERFDQGRVAATSYARAETTPSPRGSSLDLSSD